MSWFRVDDGFPDHPKVLALGEHLSPTMELAAVGLWAKVGAWCSRHEQAHFTEGALRRAAPDIDRRTLRKLANALVEVGLWEPHEHGHAFHDFDAYRAQSKHGSRIDRAQVVHGSCTDPASHVTKPPKSEPENIPPPGPARPDPSRAAGAARLPTSAPPLASPHEQAQRKRRRDILRGWAEGYGNKHIGLDLSPDARGVREALDELVGKGATYETALAAARVLSAERWWVAKGFRAPPIKHFAEHFEGYHVRASEADHEKRKDEERRAAERVRRKREREEQRRLEASRPTPEEIGELTKAFRRGVA